VRDSRFDPCLYVAFV